MLKFPVLLLAALRALQQTSGAIGSQQLLFIRANHKTTQRGRSRGSSKRPRPSTTQRTAASRLPLDAMADQQYLNPGVTGPSSRAASVRSADVSLPSSANPASSTKAVESGEMQQHEQWRPPTDGPLKTPIPKPSPSSKPVPAAALTPEQETKYKTVLDSVSQWQTLPATTAKNAPQAPITDHERMWLTRDCLLRYLRATKWSTANALKRLQSTLSWRREYGADAFTADYIGPENETGKQVQLGYDINGRPCLYLNPAKQNTKVSDRQIHHLSYMLDRTIDMMPPGVEKSALIVSFKGSGSGNVPSVTQARAVLNILQNHNPERLGKALISELPWYVTTFFKLISPFIDPVTKDKMKFNEDLRKFVPSEQLWDQHEGELKFEYDHAVYWPALDEECKRRREAYQARWEKAGKSIGEFEEYLRGGEHPPLSQHSTGASGIDEATAGVSKLGVN